MSYACFISMVLIRRDVKAHLQLMASGQPQTNWGRPRCCSLLGRLSRVRRQARGTHNHGCVLCAHPHHPDNSSCTLGALGMSAPCGRGLATKIRTTEVLSSDVMALPAGGCSWVRIPPAVQVAGAATSVESGTLWAMSSRMWHRAQGKPRWASSIGPVRCRRTNQPN